MDSEPSLVSRTAPVGSTNGVIGDDTAKFPGLCWVGRNSTDLRLSMCEEAIRQEVLMPVFHLLVIAGRHRSHLKSLRHTVV